MMTTEDAQTIREEAQKMGLTYFASGLSGLQEEYQEAGFHLVGRAIASKLDSAFQDPYISGWDTAWDMGITLELLSENKALIAHCSLLHDRRKLTIEPQIGGCARLCLGMKPPVIVNGVYEDVWDYPSIASAKRALEMWDSNASEPEGWHRHPGSGRYRPGGEKGMEYVRSEGEIQRQVTWAVIATQPGFNRQARRIMDVRESPKHITDRFPKGSRCFLVVSLDGSEKHVSSVYGAIDQYIASRYPVYQQTEYIDWVYHLYDHSVVVTVEDRVQQITNENIIARLEGRT